MFRYGDHIMGIQGHPEYTKDILLHLIDRISNRNFIEVQIFVFKLVYYRVVFGVHGFN